MHDKISYKQKKPEAEILSLPSKMFRIFSPSAKYFVKWTRICGAIAMNYPRSKLTIAKKDELEKKFKLL